MILTEDGKRTCDLPLTEAADRFEEDVLAADIHLHGYILLSGRRIVRETYFAPYDKDSLHRMYSVTKSFVSMAVGLLVRDGMVRLQDRICDYFPEYTKGVTIHPWCQRMTIEDMLTMRTCYRGTTSSRYPSEDWTESFFRVEPDHIPGTVFAYDTSATNTLTALVEKLTGKKLLDYLRDHCLRELGFSETAYIIPDPVGVSQGGSGLMCTLRDVACAAYLCNHFGQSEGRELLPRGYMMRAVSNLVPTELQPVQDEKCGYGYFFWMPRKEGFCMYGMGGQLALCFPRKDFCLLTMADTIGNPSGLQVLYDCFYHFIYPLLEDRPGDNPLAFCADGSGENPTVFCVDGSGGDSPVSGAYLFFQNTLGLKTLSVLPAKVAEGSGREQELRIGSGTREWPVRCGIGFWKEGRLPALGGDCLGRVDWKNNHLLVQVYATGEEQGHICMDIAFIKEELSLRVVGAGAPLFEKWNGLASAKKMDNL